MRYNSLPILAAILLVVALCTPAAALRYKLVDLNMPDWSLGRCYSINSSGQVLGLAMGARYTANFVYTPGVGMAYLDTSGYAFNAYAINDIGQVAGSASTGTYDWNAFLYTPGIGMTELLNKYSHAMHINAAGQVTGYYETTGHVDHAFLYTPGVGMTDLDALAGDNSIAYSVNSHGVAVGRGGSLDGPGGFVYSPETGINVISAEMTTGRDINDSGQIAGEMCAEEPWYTHAALYSPGIGTIDLGTLGGLESRARAINSSGQVIGTSDKKAEGVYAFMYTTSTGMVELPTLPGALYTFASDINDNGYIVGSIHGEDGREHAVLWEPVPEPSSVLALGVGLIGLAGTIRRRR